MDTYETIGDQGGPTHANVKETNRKSRTHREESLTHEDEIAKQTQSEDGYCMPLESSPLDATNKLEGNGVMDAKITEKQENKDHAYAVVRKDNKGKDPAATVRASTPSSKRVEPAIRPSSDHVENLNRSSSADPPQDALEGDEKKDYLYAVVDKANTKKRPPQVNITGTLFVY